MSHPIHRVQTFHIVGPFTLKVYFEDGVTQIIDFRPVLKGELYGPLQDPAVFNKVRIDPEAHTLIWPTGADFDPATLHDWPNLLDELIRMARGWAEVSTGSGGRAS